MRTVIIYYSMSGNCEQTAERIAQRIGADTLRLYPETAYPSSGLKKFLWGGKSALMGETPVLKPYDFNADNYDRIIFGFPVWASSFTPPLRTFINENANVIKGKDFAAFTCLSGSGADKALGKLRDYLGIDAFSAELVLLDPKSRPNEKNDDKIEELCRKLG